ncbi:hypothetical protein ACIOUE_35600 [Streptomyces xanthochromogenes]|uniref:hypothetical protein n=1 Tax=Streptomyces xanthochromogenes TaxID=67384 RepID=UPI00381974E6
MRTSDGQEQDGPAREAKLGSAIATQRHRRQMVMAIGITAVLAAVTTVVAVRHHDKVATLHSAEGARTTSIRFVEELGDESMYNSATRHPIVQKVYDPAHVADMQAKLDEGYAAANKGIGLDDGRPPAGATFESHTMVAGTTLKTFTSTEAIVAVWNCAIVRKTGSRPIDETTWYTTTLNLIWAAEAGEWKLRSFSEEPGPTPAPGQTPSPA